MRPYFKELPLHIFGFYNQQDIKCVSTSMDHQVWPYLFCDTKFCISWNLVTL